MARDGRLLRAWIRSVRQHGGGVPALDGGGAASRAIAELTALDFPESGLRFAPDGEITGFAGAPAGNEKPDDAGGAVRLY